MAKVSEILVVKGMNIVQPMPDEDCDGSPDYGVSKELSEDTNAKLVKKGI